MSEITITTNGSLLRSRVIAIKNARTRKFLSKNLEKQDTFTLPPGNHIIEIVFRFNIFQYPPSRFSIDVPEGKHVYFDLKEKDIAQYTFPFLTMCIQMCCWTGYFTIISNDKYPLYFASLIYICQSSYYVIRMWMITKPLSRLSNGYLELYHSWEY
ncbi:hypothetical protein [Aquirufa rosea]|uniref:Uncharacterized protein n=1 Tax=Aquirufa rosea TaxID=2509241 RepID=A0A4Q1C1K7_9BACT|nr:hypothetical protein [Aquirufa rosea]RXK51037.1 hypothetical protein ESB04_05140 [Aquirufa rosea]